MWRWGIGRRVFVRMRWVAYAKKTTKAISGYIHGAAATVAGSVRLSV